MNKYYTRVIYVNKCWNFYCIMFRYRMVHGKILVHRNLKELFVEIKLFMHVPILLIFLLLIYA